MDSGLYCRCKDGDGAAESVDPGNAGFVTGVKRKKKEGLSEDSENLLAL